MKKTLLTLSALMLSITFAFAQKAEEGTPAAQNKKEETSEKAKPAATYTNDFVYVPYSPTFKSDGTTKKIKNIILLIGDGMGPTQLSAGMYANGGELAITKLKNAGFVKTYSASHFTTDSAASGTTYGSGVKTTNGFVGVTPDGKAVPNIPEKISPKGLASGVVTTDNISGATPSSFYAHQGGRSATTEILKQLPTSKLDFFAAGCQTLWTKYAPEQVAELAKEGFTIINDYNKIAENTSAKRLGVITYDKDVTPIKDGRGDFLPVSTREAIKFLNKKSPKGFFLMVEGAQIDWGSHNHDPKYTITEMIDFDMAVSEALKFADENGETLVIITADHETGGMTIPSGNIANRTINAVFTTAGHSGTMVPIFAYGPYSEMFKGVQNNIDVHAKIMEVFAKVK